MLSQETITEILNSYDRLKNYSVVARRFKTTAATIRYHVQRGLRPRVRKIHRARNKLWWYYPEMPKGGAYEDYLRKAHLK